jgi:thiamine-phosphate pyrophosphorylase
VGDDAIVGLSTPSTQPAHAGAASGADYLAVGPVHATPTKPGRTAAGVEYVRWAAEHATKPWFAIGGLDATNVAGLGAERIVVVRAITEAGDPERAARALRTALEETPVGAAQP